LYVSSEDSAFLCEHGAVRMAGTAYSQTTFASITGTVTDATGAVVRGATIAATNVETNIKTAAKSNEDGNYTIAQLKEGTYTVRAEAPGFKSFVVEKVGLVARDVRRVDASWRSAMSPPRSRSPAASPSSRRRPAVSVIPGFAGAQHHPNKFAKLVGHPQSLTWFAGAGRQQRDAIRR